MKIQIALLAAALLAGCAQQASNAEEAVATPAPAAAAASDVAPARPAEAATAAAMGMHPAAHQKMAEDAGSMGMSAEAHDAMGKDGAGAKAGAHPQAAATGVGVVKAIDPAAGKVTIAHGPIEALKWPAMTMAFKASPELLAQVKEGNRVHFEFNQDKGGSTLTVLRRQP